VLFGYLTRQFNEHVSFLSLVALAVFCLYATVTGNNLFRNFWV